MKTITTYLRKTDTGVAEVDSTNRPLRNVAAVIRNEQAQINLRIFDGAVATTPMTGEQLAGYVSWYLRIGPQADMRGPVCIEAGNESITVSEAGVVSITIATTDTVQAASEIGNATRAIWTADLAAFPVDSENPTMVLQWRIAYINRVASENEPPPESQTSDFYQKPVIDAKFAAVGASIPAATTVARGTIQLASAAEAAAGLDTSKAIVPATLKTELDKIESTLNIPRDVADLADDDGLLFDGDYDSLTNKPTIPHDVADLTDSGGLIPADLTDLTDNTGILSGKVDVVAGKELSDNNYSDTDLAKVAKIDLETLAELTGSSVTVAPWTQTKYTAGGVCTITATGWALSGFQWSQIVITVLADATPAIAGTEEVSEDDALSEAGVYHAAFLNLDGKIYFHVSSFTPAEVEE